MRHTYILILWLLCGYNSWAQDKGSYQDKFAMGNKLLAKKDYAGALRSYQDAYNADSSGGNVVYKIGLCLYNIGGSEALAIKYFEKASKKVSKQYDANSASEKSASPLAYYYLGVLDQKTYRFGEAVSSFKSLKTFYTPADKEYPANTDHLISQCNSAKMFIMAPSNAKIINLGDSVNSIYSDYNPLVLQDESSVIFTSRRPFSKNNTVVADGEYHAYIYISYFKKDTLWTQAKIYDASVNFGTDNRCCAISPDGQQMILYCNTDKDKNGGLYMCHMGDEHWEAPARLESDINSAGNQSSACLSPDGNTIYFVSDRPGGMGGKDIWRCVKLPNGNWSRALNLGKSVNTPYDEETPFMHADAHTFFFSSQGHNSMGGFDIFFSQILDSGKFSEPFNLGYPINTPDDEIHFSLSLDGKNGYFNSNRPGGKGKQDIYKVVMPHATERPLTVIRGQVLPAPGESLSEDVHILATDSATQQVVGDFKPIHSSGRFTIIVPPGRTYSLSYLDDDNEFYKEVINVPEDAGYKEIHKALNLAPHSVKGPANDTAKSAHPH
jgi:hypothetical protein